MLPVLRLADRSRGFMVSVDVHEESGDGKSQKVVLTFSEKPFIEQVTNMKQLFNEAVQSGCSEIVIDFARVDYLCSTSLAELVRMKKITVEKGIILKMLNFSTYVMEIFRTTRLLKFFNDEI